MTTDAPLDLELDEIVALVPDHLVRQRWFDHDEVPSDVSVADSERWLDGSTTGDPALWWLLVDVAHDGRELGRYQLFVGGRANPVDHDFLHGKDTELLGGVSVAAPDDETVEVALYDATIDSPLAIEILRRVAPGRDAKYVRALTVEQSNSSIVYDEKIIVKLFRRIHRGDNPDVDAVDRLLAAGYSHVPEQLGVLARDDQHLAVAREFLAGASDGWHLALTSLRIVLGAHEHASSSGGDFGPDARRLGTVTAELHLRLADAYGTTAADLSEWVAGFRSQLDRVRKHVPAEKLSARYDQVASLADAGPAMRIHGDLHLGQTLRADAGWYVIDFEGEPARPLAERLRPSSPLRDVAGMLRSFHYAAEVSRWERSAIDEESHELVDEWEDWSREQFLAGYFGTPGIGDILPGDASRDVLLRAFELDKAVYEVAYEIGFRPTWAAIPLGAIERLLK